MAQQFQPTQSSSTSMNASALAETYQLGTIIKAYTNNAVVWALYGIALGIFFVVLAIWSIVVPLWSWLGTTLFCGGFLGLILFFGGLSQLFSGLRKRNRDARIYICMNGLMRIQPGQVEVIHWDNITEVRKRFTEIMPTSNLKPEEKTYTLKQYIVRQVDGQEMVLDNVFGDFEEIGKVIEQHVTERLLPATLATYNTGSPVDFGWVRVSQAGISAGSSPATLPWNAVRKIKIRNGIIIIEKSDGFLDIIIDNWDDWRIIYTDGEPNVCVFMALLNQVVEGEKLYIK